MELGKRPYVVEWGVMAHTTEETVEDGDWQRVGRPSGILLPNLGILMQIGMLYLVPKNTGFV